MAGLILRRILATIPVMLVVAAVVFLLLHLSPGDPAAILAGDNASSDDMWDPLESTCRHASLSIL